MAEPDNRRFNLKVLCTAALSGLVGLFPLAAGLGVILHPIQSILRGKKKVAGEAVGDDAADDAWILVTSLDSVPEDGAPRVFPVVTDVVDSWTKTPNTAIGAVFLSRKEPAAGSENGEVEVVAFQSDCPHLGCRIDYESEEDKFTCPCHVSGFARDGERLYGPSLRGLDSLDVKLVARGDQQQVMVKFQRFRASIAERIAGAMRQFFDWLDDRTGYRELLHDALYEHVPGGARWRYVWGSALTFAFVTQLVTGVILWAAYSPSAHTAWESVYYIQHEMWGGWLLRGVHHFMAQAMIILLALHFVQVVVDGAYRAPREINFWLGLVLMQLVLGLSLTGYLLPWDQKGYWATKVATNMMGLVPIIGGDIQRVVVGGAEYGHHTLTRFFALHAGVLPGLLILFLVLHLALFRKHGIKAKEPFSKPDATFWPDQVLRDAVACAAVAIAVMFAIAWGGYEQGEGFATPGGSWGAELGAPANPAESYAAARPEWYFLFLFQLLKYMEDFPPIVGALVVPGIVMTSLFLMPLIGRWKLGHAFNIVWTVALLGAAGTLTFLAWNEDHNGVSDKSLHYLHAVEEAEIEAARAVALVQKAGGIPKQGALHLLANDPLTQGPRLFRQHCASCHSHYDSTEESPHGIVPKEPSAPNLFRIGSRAWVAGMLSPEKIKSIHFFGGSAQAEGDMVGWVEENIGGSPRRDGRG